MTDPCIPIMVFGTAGVEPVCAAVTRCMWRHPALHLLGASQAILDASGCLDAPESMPAGAMWTLQPVAGIGPSGVPQQPLQRLVSR